jgi:Domain of unknown function (DUF4389)
MVEHISEKFQNINIWHRLFLMLVYAMLAGLVRMLIWLLVVFQLGSMLIAGDVNRNVLGFGRSLAAYMYHIYLFLTFNTDDKAFPFAKWSLYSSPDLHEFNLRR